MPPRAASGGKTDSGMLFGGRHQQLTQAAPSKFIYQLRFPLPSLLPLVGAVPLRLRSSHWVVVVVVVSLADRPWQRLSASYHLIIVVGCA